MRSSKWKQQMDAAKKALRGNSGAGLIVVLISVLFILILGGGLLYASYNVYMMRIAEKRAQTNFTSADAGMEEIRAGLQTAVSDATGAGYDNVIQNYTTGGTTATFNAGFLKAMNEWKAEAALPDGTGKNELNLFASSSDKITKYNVAVLNTFLDKPAGDATYELAAVTASGEKTLEEDKQNRDLWGEAVQDTDAGTLTLKGVKLTYTKGGYATTITTDLFLSVPDVPVSSADNTANIKDYVIVADRGVEVTENGKQLTVKGDMYAGSLNIKNGGHATIADNCTMTVGRTLLLNSAGQPQMDAANPGNYKRTTGDVTIDGVVKYDNMGNFNGRTASSLLQMNSNAKLWAHEISVDGGTMSMTGGDTTSLYVADDLNIGRYASVQLKGAYFGFGNGTSVEDTVSPTGVSDYSSSILFRTKGQEKSSLDMTGLTNLTLAGTSFVQPKKSGNGSEVRMGSSISSRSEQLAYLIPAGFMGGRSNPEIANDSEVAPADESAAVKAAILKPDNQKKPLWSGSSDTLATYGITSADRISVMSYPISGAGGQRVYYAFMNFPDRETANRYFTAFFRQNSDTVQTYLKQYMDLQGTPAEKVAGTGLVKAGSDYNLTDAYSDSAEGDVAASCAKYQTIYMNMSRTMTTNSAALTTPFYNYIDAEKLNEIIDEKNPGGNTAELKFSYNDGVDGYIVLARGNYDLHLSSKNPIVICDGNVTVRNSDMVEGLVICSGKLTVSSDLTILKDQAIGRDAITKILDDKGEGVWKGGGGSDEPAESTWSANDLVQFSNWKKNAE